MNYWNDNEIICKENKFRLLLNGRETVNYTESDNAIPQEGLIGLQIHGGGKAKVYYRDIFIRKL